MTSLLLSFSPFKKCNQFDYILIKVFSQYVVPFRNKRTRVKNSIIHFHYSKCEHSQLKVELENVQEVQQENIMLKKQLLNHDRELVEENANLKKAFAASDEARGELETAFDLMKENYELLKTDMSNVHNSTVENLSHEEHISELQKIIDEKSDYNESLKQQNDELK